LPTQTLATAERGDWWRRTKCGLPWRIRAGHLHLSGCSQHAPNDASGSEGGKVQCTASGSAQLMPSNELDALALGRQRGSMHLITEEGRGWWCWFQRIHGRWRNAASSRGVGGEIW
jgi:hypothetical protein